jgi:NAD(P)-dependent dehydrogenase (short-subunit alcohol dehydrogenase family)
MPLISTNSSRSIRLDEFSCQVALITGAAGKGIGRAIASRLAAGGASLAITDIHEKRVKSVVAELQDVMPGASIVGHALDVADRAGVDAVVAATEAEIGPVRILVNNAAENLSGSIFDFDPAAWDRVLAVNLSGPWYLARATMPQMRDAGGGVIINITTYAPDVGGEGLETPYAATKGGLNALTRALAWEGGPAGIRCNAISMGIVAKTKYADDNPEQVKAFGIERSPLGILPDPTDIAEAAAFLAGDGARAITGEILNVASGTYMRS